MEKTETATRERGGKSMKIKGGKKLSRLTEREKRQAISVFAIAYTITTLILSYLAR